MTNHTTLTHTTLTYKTIKLKFDYERFAHIVSADEGYFKKYGKVIDTPTGPAIFKDNGCKILSIAHLDTVVKNPVMNGVFYSNKKITHDWQFQPIVDTPKFTRKRKTKHKPFHINDDNASLFLAASGLDDRLGAYVILELLPQLGIETDILLTTNEERGQSTARGFYEELKKIEEYKDKSYNWLVEFDRMGDDLVTYKYKEKEFHEALKESGFKLGGGSYSDICEMGKFGVCALNVGIGYYRPHSQDSFMSFDDLWCNLYNFLNFYNKYKDVKFKFDNDRWSNDQKQQYKHQHKQSWQGWQGYGGGYQSPYPALGDGYKHEVGVEVPLINFMCICGRWHMSIGTSRYRTCDCGKKYYRSSITGNVLLWDNKIGVYQHYKTIDWKDASHSNNKQELKTETCSFCNAFTYGKMGRVDNAIPACMSCRTKFKTCPLCRTLYYDGLSIGICQQCLDDDIYQNSFYDVPQDADTLDREQDEQQTNA